jgi:arylsulfatase
VERPDIVLVMTDQQRFDWIGGSSEGFFETPALDALATTGIVFDHAYSAATTCIPARTSLLTGLHHNRVPRVPGNPDGPDISDPLAMREGVWTIARALRQVGYETALFGRMHFAPMHADHGFDTMRICENISPGSGYGPSDLDDYTQDMVAAGRPDWRVWHPGGGGLVPHTPGVPRAFPAEAACHPTGWIEEETLRFLRTRSRDRPLFLIVSFPHPHAPYDPPEPYASMYDPADVDVPTDGFDRNAFLLTSFPQTWASAARWAAPIRRPSGAAGDAEYRRIMTAIRALVRHIDDALGHIASELDLARTALFFTSDHGDYGGRRGLLHKVPWIPFEDLVRVPLVAAGGAVAAHGTTVRDCVQSASFAATCLDLAGAAPPDDQGDFPSLLPFLSGRPDPGWSDTPVFAAMVQDYPMVRFEGHKVIRSFLFDETLVFDLEQDPGETRSLDAEPGYGPLLEHAIELFRQQLAKPEPARVRLG